MEKLNFCNSGFYESPTSTLVSIGADAFAICSMSQANVSSESYDDLVEFDKW